MAGVVNQSTSMTSFSDNVTEMVTALTSEPSLFSGGNVEFKMTMKKIADVLLIVLVCIVMMSLGCGIDIKVVKAHFRRPTGLLIGIVCQFILFPAITFGLAHALQLEKWDAIGMILVGTSPGGSMSNILTYYCEGDITLSVSMTAISTLVALGMMPLNLWIYTRSWADHKTVIPYQSILIGLASMLIPVAIGMLILVKFPIVAKWILRIGSTLGMIITLGVIAMYSYLYPHVFHSGWGVWAAGGMLAPLGLIFGFIAASIFRQPQPFRRAIAIETSVQNVALCMGLITISYGTEVYLQILAFPVIYTVLGLAFLLLVCAVYQIQKNVRRRAGLKRSIQIDDGESKNEVYDNEVYKNKMNCDETVQDKIESSEKRSQIQTKF